MNMIGLWNTLIQQLNGSVIILAILLIAVLIITFKSGSWISSLQEWKKNVDKHDKKIDDLQKMSAKIDVIYQRVIPNFPIKSQSPISLTESGREIMKEIHAEKIFERILPTIQDEFKKEFSEKNAYDIQTRAMAYAEENIESKLTSEEIIKVKNAAFTRGLMKDDILAIFGLLLRDKTLKDFNIPVSDIDKHAPE